MTKIAIVSDLHLEFGSGWVLPQTNNESETVLVLAGDIILANQIENYMDFFEDISDRFKEVVYVMGNHEHYKFDLTNTKTHIEHALRYLENITVLENELVKVSGVTFYGATLWSSILSDDYGYVRSMMSDYHIIKNKSYPLTPKDTTLLHEETVEWLVRNVKDNEKNVVVTHHYPSPSSINKLYLGERLNCAFGTDLDAVIKLLKPNIWIHGHTHSQFDYILDETRVICNPRGYPNENGKFKIKRIEL